MILNRFSSFIIRHGFKPDDLITWDSLHPDNIPIAQQFPPMWAMRSHLRAKERRKLNIALLLAGYMAEFQTEQHDLFAKFSSELSDEEWKFALKFCPYHEIAEVSQNLPTIQSALEEAYLGLNTAMMGMEVSLVGEISEDDVYYRERSKATVHLLNFVALYSAYIDISRRLRDLLNLKHSEPYSRALQRILSENLGAHSFLKDYRNFQLHYRIAEPDVVVRKGSEHSAILRLHATELLYSGYSWKKDSRKFLQTDREIDLISVVSGVLKDVKKVVRFHHNLVDRRLPAQRYAYRMYCREREKLKHLSSAVFDAGRIFRRPKPMIKRLLDEKLVNTILESSIPDKDAVQVLFEIANRFRNLRHSEQREIRTDIEKAVRGRSKYPESQSYVMGKPHVQPTTKKSEEL